jgi:protein-S-isoprenylcysteine O-methyltransferase Ste14
MPLKEEFEQTGAWLFKWRSYLPVGMLILVILTLFDYHYLGNNLLYHQLWVLFCMAVSYLGLFIRIMTIGHTPEGTSGRNTERQRADALNTTGMYSIVRHPLYLGNFFMAMGIVLFPRLWYVVVIYIFAFWIYYERIMFAEEEFLRRKNGERYETWAARTPAFIPNFSKWTKPSLPFSLKTVLKREYSGFFAVILTLFFLETIGDLFAQGRVIFDTMWIYLLVLGFLVWLVFRTLKRKTRVLDVKGR